MKYLISDTREKKNQHVLDHFDKVGIRYEIAKLDYGDYMDAYRTDISIDRKQNIGELARNCTRESERFRREIERANKADSKLGVERMMTLLLESNSYYIQGDEMLSDSIYYYCAGDGTLSVCDEGEVRV